jgi:phage shock protein A
MSLFKRITATLTTRVNTLVNELENHDAVVESGIAEMRQAYAKAKVRFTRMTAEGERLRRKLDEQRRDAMAWRERALACKDEEKALECLRRGRLASGQVTSLEGMLERHRELEGRLSREIEAVRARIGELEHKRHQMRSREATADAAWSIQRMDAGRSLDLEDIFERWEMRVTEAELTTDASPVRDPLEAEFVAEEERASLAAELAELERERESRHED